MNYQPVLSIIIPVYNGKKFIERTLHSIISQPSNDYEIIIIDDGSTDDSAQIIQEIAKIQSSICLISTKNYGVCHARNLGIESLRGMYVLFMDQDDVLIPNSYDSSLVNRLKNYYMNNIDVFSFRYLKSNDSITQFDTSETRIQTQNNNHVYMISGLPIHFAFYHKRLFDIEHIRFMESKYIDLDMQFTHKLYYHSKKIEFDNELLFYCWVIHHESAGHSDKHLIEKHYDALKGWKTLVDYHLQNKDMAAANYCKAYLCGVFLWFLKGYYKSHISDKSIKYCIDTLRIGGILSEYRTIEHHPTVEELDEYYNRRLLFIVKNRLYKYKRTFGLYLVRHFAFVKRKYMNSKYPYDIEKVKAFTNKKG